MRLGGTVSTSLMGNPHSSSGCVWSSCEACEALRLDLWKGGSGVVWCCSAQGWAARMTRLRGMTYCPSH